MYVCMSVVCVCVYVCMYEAMYVGIYNLYLSLYARVLNQASSNSHQLLLLGLELNLQLTTCTLSLRELYLLRHLYIEHRVI